MSIAALAQRHSRAAALVAVALVIGGVIAALALPSSIYPPLQFPRIAIVVHSGTLPPQSMMLTVTRPLEEAVMSVPGIRRVRSRSIRGAAEISAQFAPSTDMIVALQQVQNSVAEVTGVTGEEIELQDIFTFVPDRTAAGGAVEGTFTASGHVPQVVESMRARGENLDSSMFSRPPSR